MRRDEVLAQVRELARTKRGALAAQAVAQSITPTEIIAQELYIPQYDPTRTTTVTVGEPYQHEGQVYKAKQPYIPANIPDYRPNGNDSQSEVYHTTDPAKAKPYVAPSGNVGVYAKGEVMIWTDGTIQRSRINANGFTPESYAQGWEVVA